MIPSRTASDTILQERKREEELTRKYLEEERQRRQRELDEKEYECEVCFDDCKIEDMYTFDECFHRFCWTCSREYFTDKIRDGETRTITCPKDGCTHVCSYQEVKQVVPRAVFAKYEDFLVSRWAVHEGGSGRSGKRAASRFRRSRSSLTTW